MMARQSLNNAGIEFLQGNIADQPDVEAVVNAANAALRIGGGVAGALHRAAGPGLEEECRPLAPIDPGQAVITGGHELPNRHVIHCLGPVYGHDEPAEELLAACYRNALRLCREHGIASIAFPALSTGAFGYPLGPAARIALGTVIAELPACPSLHLVRFVLYGAEDLRIYERTFQELTDGGGGS